MALSNRAIGRVSEVFVRADLGDERLVRRAVELAAALARSPKESLPRVWSSSAMLEAGYRFLRNERAGFTSLLEPFQQVTRERALEAERVLVLHDTTDVTCPGGDPDEVGHLQTGQPGFYVHHALCVSAEEKRPLGLIWSQLWGRSQRRMLGRPRSGPALAKLQERESDRWLEGLTQAGLWLQGVGQVVHVMDREADSFRLFEHAHSLNADFVIRCRHDRRVAEGRITDELVQAPVKVKRLIAIRSRKTKTMPSHTYKGRHAREVELSVKAQKVEIEPPRYMPGADPIELNIVQVLEQAPPAGETPISWVLATTLPTSTKAQLEAVIDIYRARWVVEELHKVLKAGCALEKRQVESFESITTLLAIFYPIACELLDVRTRARQDVPASQVLRSSLLDCLRAHPDAEPLPPNPTAQQALRVIAGIGGHIKYNGPPGWQTLAKGYVEMLAFERGWLAALAQKDVINR